MTFRDHFSATAGGYAAHRPTYPPELVDFLADLAPRTGLAWDAGCGSGQLSVPLARRFDRVVATDASEEQLARAAEHERVEYRAAPAEASDLPGGIVDLAVAGQAAHWFELDGYYAEVRRVAAADGAIALVSYGGTRISPEIDPVVESFRLETLAPLWPPERAHVESGYRSLPFPFAEVESPALEIRVEWTCDDMVSYVRTWSALRQADRAGASAAADALVSGLRERLAPVWSDTRTVAWPLAIRAGRVS